MLLFLLFRAVPIIAIYPALVLTDLTLYLHFAAHPTQRKAQLALAFPAMSLPIGFDCFPSYLN